MKLKEWREDIGRTVADVAEELGVTRQAVGNYERGRLPGAETLAEIIRMTAGEVTPNDWFDFHALAPFSAGEPDVDGMGRRWRSEPFDRRGRPVHPLAATDEWRNRELA